MAIITKDTKKGQEFSGKLKVLSDERAWAFSGGRFAATGWPSKNIHTDLEYSKGRGMPSRAVSATQLMGYMTELMIDMFGVEWLRTGKLNMKFFAQVDVGSKLRARAVVSSSQAEGSKSKFELDVWVEDSNGNKVATGTAAGLA